MYEECVKVLGGTPLDKEEYWEMKRANLSWDKLLILSGLSIDEKIDTSSCLLTESSRKKNWVRMNSLRIVCVH